MNYKNILGLGLIFASCLSTYSTSFAAPAKSWEKQLLHAFDSTKPNSAIPTPIRVAKGTVQIVRNEISHDNSTGQSDYKRTPVCTHTINVGLHDARKNESTPYYVKCADTINGKLVEIQTSVLFSIQRGALIDGLPETDFKYLSVMAHSSFEVPDRSNPLPEIPLQMSYTKDLDQKYLGTISLPKQFIMCVAESEPIDAPVPNPRVQSQSSCSVVNPLGYQVIWEIEDTI